MIKYQRKNSILTESLQEHLVMMDINLGNYFSLNQVASRIWELLASPKSKEELCQALLNEFDVVEKQCRNEVEDHLSELAHLKLISEVE